MSEVTRLGAVAQLARAPALQAGGPGFESPQLHHVILNFKHNHFNKWIDFNCGLVAQLVRVRH